METKKTQEIRLKQRANILIFTNQLPDLKFLYTDRIKIWTINDNDLLSPFKHDLLHKENFINQWETLIKINNTLNINKQTLNKFIMEEDTNADKDNFKVTSVNSF